MRITLKIAGALQKQENQIKAVFMYITMILSTPAAGDSFGDLKHQCRQYGGRCNSGSDIKIVSINGVPDIFKAMSSGESNGHS
jgi:hypothetical protein